MSTHKKPKAKARKSSSRKPSRRSRSSQRGKSSPQRKASSRGGAAKGPAKAGRGQLLHPRLQARVMSFLKKASGGSAKGRAVGVKELAETFELDQEQTRQLRQFLKHQTRNGALEPRRRGRYLWTGDAVQKPRRGDDKARSRRKPREEREPMESALDALDVAEFPQEVLEQALRASQEPLSKAAKGRLDLRDAALFTIDGEDAKDFDDAVGVLPRQGGGHRVMVAIADVAHYVRPGTALDEEAGRRATSVYLPGRCLPMLPEALSNGACSLRPNEDRLSLVVFLDYDAQGRLQDSSVHEAIICSQARFTYNQVHEILEALAEEREIGDIHPMAWELSGSLVVLASLTRGLRKQRTKRGAMELDLPEPKFLFDDEGKLLGIERYRRNQAHFLIEELMLQANEAVASFLQKHRVPGIFRNHGQPSQEKLEHFAELLAHYGATLAVDGEGKIKCSAKDLSKVLARFEDHPAQPLLHQWYLRCMQQAVYEADNQGHYGLSLEQYLHFTSPIRRYPDLCVHRMVKIFLGGRWVREHYEFISGLLDDVAAHCSTRERMAMKAEREAVAERKVEFIQDFVGQEAEGRISAVTPFGCFVELDEHFVEGLIHVRNLRGRFEYDELRMSLHNPRTGESFQIGDRLKVQIENASVARREIDFALVERL